MRECVRGQIRLGDREREICESVCMCMRERER